jgi:cytochrome c oxidase subunit 4
MTDSNHAEGHHGPKVQAYLVIFGALSIFTLLSFVFNYAARTEPPIITHTTSFLLILAVAVIKASLVGMYFMHLKFDWSKLYFMIVPAFILGTMMIFVLLPDIVLAWHNY